MQTDRGVIRSGGGSWVRGWRRRVVIALLAAGVVGISGMTAASAPGEPAGDTSSNLTNIPYQPGGTPVRGGTLNYATYLTLNSWTPWMPNTAVQVWLDHDIFDGLVNLSATTGKPVPGVADSWTISKSGLVYTFHIRPGIKFSNGQPVTTADVVYTLHEWANPKINVYWTALASMIKSASAVGSSHVKVVLKSVTPAFLDDLTLSGAGVVPAATVKKDGAAAFGLHPVGTGPFMVSQYSPTSLTVKLRRNPHYWQAGRPYLDGVTIHILTNDTTRMLAVTSGSADIADNVPFSQVGTVNAAQATKVVSQHFGAIYEAFFNTTKGPLHSVLVRQALSYATPVSDILNVVFHGLATPANSPYPKTEYWNANLKPYPLDTGKATALLDRAGYKSGFPLTISVNTGDTLTQQVVAILQSAWAKVGVKLQVRTLDSGSAFTDFSKLDYEMWLAPVGYWNTDITSDDEWAEYFAAPSAKASTTSFPFNGFYNARGARDVAIASSTDNNQLRRKLFGEFQRIMHEQVPELPIAFTPQLVAVRSNVHNYVTNYTGAPLLGQVWLSH